MTFEFINPQIKFQSLSLITFIKASDEIYFISR